MRSTPQQLWPELKKEPSTSSSLQPSVARQAQHPNEFFLRERRSLRRSLNFDEASQAGHNEIRVGMGGRVLGVVEIDHRFASDNAAGYAGDMILEWALAQDRALRHPV